MRRIFQFAGILLFSSNGAFSQEDGMSIFNDNGVVNRWQMLDGQKDQVPGVGADRAYEELLAGKKSVPVVVAIIDSGTESFHPDLKANIWLNVDEIPGNGIDDDHNGYADDLHGWSFIGGPGGDVSIDNSEFIRVYKGLKKRFETVVDAKNLSNADKKDFDLYLKMKKDYEGKLKVAEENLMNFVMIEMFYKNADELIKKSLGKDTYTLEEVQAIEATDELMNTAKGLILLGFQEGFMAQILEAKEHYEASTKYQLNLDFDPRYMVGDNYNDVNEKIYGNDHIDGPEADHGTHVGGIVGASRNGFGMDGVADNVQLMIIRCVPNGDERDKDVANSIRYAADNGARVINMSFGKSYSPQKDAVDAAVKYAESKGVLLIHASGNDGKDNDVGANFPKDIYNDGGICSTWLEVGASGNNTSMVAADFSNYGKKTVDVFAPGENIYSTVPGNKYQENSGTSMASPVAAGVAAAIMSYFPKLSAKDVKEIMMKSATVYKDARILKYVERKKMGKFFAKIFIGKKKDEEAETSPRTYKMKKVNFTDYSVTGGVVNMYEAVRMAQTWKSK